MELIDNRQIWFRLPSKEVTNVDDPEVFTVEFDRDREYFTEENGTRMWRIENGAMSVDADKSGTLTYMQVYEQNAVLKARIRYSNAIPESHDTKITLMLRYNAPEAYVKLKYVPVTAKWSIVDSPGIDHIPMKYTKKAGYEITAD